MKNDIIQLEGGFYEKCKVVMLATEEPSNFWLTANGVLMYSKEKVKANTNQQLHLLSGEEIKEGDWMYLENSKTVEKCINSSFSNATNYSWKVISSTDSSLKVTLRDYAEGNITYAAFEKSLPRPSDSFIKKYCEKYNKGEIIEEVLVEYETDYSSIPENEDDIIGSWRYYVDMKLKVTADNTITIKSLESKMYTREEVTDLLHKFNDQTNTIFQENLKKQVCDEWIDKNM